MGVMATVKQVTVRLTGDDLALIELVQNHAGLIARADALRFALRECVRSLGIDVKKPKAAKTKP